VRSLPSDAPYGVSNEEQDEYEAKWREVGGADVDGERSKEPGNSAEHYACSLERLTKRGFGMLLS
jgi:hypothetical protein